MDFRRGAKMNHQKGVSSSINQNTRPGLIPGFVVAAVVPAFNESKGIGRVLSTLQQINFLSEIIVIDDGSTDATAEQARQCASADARIRVVQHGTNLGKGQAIFSAWRATRAPYLLTLDADLINLNPEHVYQLIQPVREKQADMTLGLFQGGYWRTDASHRLTPWLTGQRCFRADLLQYVSQPAASGYGIETALTIAARQKNWRTQYVMLQGVSHPPSETHRGLWHGLKTRSRMYAHVVRAWYVAAGWQGVVSRLKEWKSMG